MPDPFTNNRPAYYQSLVDMERAGDEPEPAYIQRQQLLALDRITEQLRRVADALETMLSKQ
jgi:hypothetical protein